MWILVTNISPAATHDDIYRFAKRGLKGRWMPIATASRGKVKRCGIMRISNSGKTVLEFHGLVSIEPIRSAMQAIERLHGRKMRGVNVGVRRYFSRSTERDRRNLFEQQPLSEEDERRRSDRRRAEIRVDKTYRHYEV